MELHISSDNDDAFEEALLNGISGWLLSSPDANTVLKRLAFLINGAGTAISHSVTTARKGEREEMNDESEWVTSPKDLVEFLLASGKIVDKERLAESYGEYQVYQELEEIFNLPDAEEEIGS